jgi:hypothetical protein
VRSSALLNKRTVRRPFFVLARVKEGLWRRKRLKSKALGLAIVKAEMAGKLNFSHRLAILQIYFFRLIFALADKTSDKKAFGQEKRKNYAMIVLGRWRLGHHFFWRFGENAP